MGKIKMERGGHGDRGKVGRPVTSRANVVKLRKRSDLFQVSDSPAVHDRHPDVVDQLFGDQDVGIPDGIKHFAESQRSRGVGGERCENLPEVHP